MTGWYRTWRRGSSTKRQLTLHPKPAGCQALSAQALRLCLQDPKNSLLPSKPSMILNKTLEVIRLNKLCKDGWTNPFMTDKLSNEQFQQLERQLSTSYS
ncbi:MAG: hypothetical protein J3Q66DRAFT_388172 [Benniella sp.]|nr:MAG: hypothetical protein J3Q66DRAFT_388172 [Benniella sp.]